MKKAKCKIEMRQREIVQTLVTGEMAQARTEGRSIGTMVKGMEKSTSIRKKHRQGGWNGHCNTAQASRQSTNTGLRHQQQTASKRENLAGEGD